MGNNVPLVSFVVPAYNVQDYIEFCIESIFTQEYPNVECICVNDGSTDKTGQILDELSLHHTNLKILHQENQGVSVARNNALKIVQGDFIVFVDSDDYVLPSFLNVPMRCFSKKQELDIWTGALYPVDDQNNMIATCSSKYTFDSFETSQPLKDCQFRDKKYLLFCVGGKIIRRNVITENQISFLPYVGHGEDSLFMAECLCFAREMIADGCCAAYMRRLRAGSQTTRHWAEQVDGYISLITSLVDFAYHHDKKKELTPLAVQWSLGRFSVMFHPGYKNLWMRQYIVALCRHHEFKTMILGTIANYGDKKYSLVARMMSLTPRRMLIEILFLAVCLNNLLRGSKS